MIRKKKTARDREPVHCDLELLDSLYLDQEGSEIRISNWINPINVFGVTTYFEGIISDTVALLENPPLGTTQDYSWTANLGFVYVPGDGTSICTASLDCLRKDYSRGALKVDETPGQRIVTDCDPQGTMLVKEMKRFDIQFFEGELTAMTKQTLLTLLQHHSLESIEESSTTKKKLVGRILQAQKTPNRK